jgi:hypothetical protein
VSANLIFPIYCHNDIQHLVKIFCDKGLQFFCTRSSLLESVTVTEFQATEAYSSWDLTKAKYSISRLSRVEKEIVIVQISPSNLSEFKKRKST